MLTAMDPITLSLLLIAIPIVYWIVYKYLALPLVVRSKNKIALNPEYVRYDPNLLSPEVSAFFSQTLHGLIARGFTVIDYVSKPGAARKVTPVIVYLTNRSTGDMATIAAIYTEPLGVPTLKSFNVFCHRIFTDGSRVLFANHVPESTGSVFKTRPYAHGYSFDGQMDIGVFYDLFLFAVRKHADGKTAVIPQKGKEMEAFREADHDTHEFQVKSGLLRVDAAQGVYEKTLYGAYYSTWSLLWPVKPIKRMRRRAKAAKLLAEYRAAQNRASR